MMFNLFKGSPKKKKCKRVLLRNLLEKFRAYIGLKTDPTLTNI